MPPKRKTTLETGLGIAKGLTRSRTAKRLFSAAQGLTSLRRSAIEGRQKAKTQKAQETFRKIRDTERTGLKKRKEEKRAKIKKGRETFKKIKATEKRGLQRKKEEQRAKAKKTRETFRKIKFTEKRGLQKRKEEQRAKAKTAAEQARIRGGKEKTINTLQTKIERVRERSGNKALEDQKRLQNAVLDTIRLQRSRRTKAVIDKVRRKTRGPTPNTLLRKTNQSGLDRRKALAQIAKARRSAAKRGPTAIPRDRLDRSTKGIIKTSKSVDQMRRRLRVAGGKDATLKLLRNNTPEERKRLANTIRKARKTTSSNTSSLTRDVLTKIRKSAKTTREGQARRALRRNPGLLNTKRQ